MNKNNFSCVYAHLIQSLKCGCHHARKNCIAEKEFGVCHEQKSSVKCQALYQILKTNSQFALHIHNHQELSVGQKNKIKLGGLLALQNLVDGDVIRIEDIDTLVKTIEKKWDSFEKLPFVELMPKITSFKFRQPLEK
jgi:hypothetical protein